MAPVPKKTQTQNPQFGSEIEDAVPNRLPKPGTNPPPPPSILSPHHARDTKGGLTHPRNHKKKAPVRTAGDGPRKGGAVLHALQWQSPLVVDVTLNGHRHHGRAKDHHRHDDAP